MACQVLRGWMAYAQAVFDKATDTRPHLIEGSRRRSNFLGAVLGKRRRIDVHVQSLRATRAKSDRGAVIHRWAHHENATMAIATTSVEPIEPGDYAPIPSRDALRTTSQN